MNAGVGRHTRAIDPFRPLLGVGRDLEPACETIEIKHRVASNDHPEQNEHHESNASKIFNAMKLERGTRIQLFVTFLGGKAGS